MTNHHGYQEIVCTIHHINTCPQSTSTIDEQTYEHTLIMILRHFNEKVHHVSLTTKNVYALVLIDPKHCFMNFRFYGKF